MRATSETLAPGSSDAATSRSFSSCDHRRRRSTDVITSALEIVIALLLGLPLGPAAFASVKQGGPQRRNTLHRIERLMRQQALKARPRRRRLPPDLGERQVAAVAPNGLDRSFETPAPHRKLIAAFTYVWTVEGWLYVPAAVNLCSRRVVGWSMNPSMTAHPGPTSLVVAS